MHGKDGTDEEDLFEKIKAAVLSADATHHDSAYIDHMASRAHIMPAIEGALKKYGDAHASRPRLQHGIEPHFKSKPQPVSKSAKVLENLLKNAF